MTEHVMCELEIAARRSVDWCEDGYNACDTPEEGHLALLVQLALGGFYYDAVLEANDMLRLTGDPRDLEEAVAEDLAKAGCGLSGSGFLSFKEHFSDWKVKLREIIERLEELRPEDTS